MTRYPNGVQGFVWTQGLPKTLPQTTHSSIATVTGGRVLLIAVIGKVTTVIQTQANNAKLAAYPTGLSAVDLCAVLNITAAAVSTLLSITGTFADALIASANAIMPFQAAPIVLSEGALHLDCAASSTGGVQWTFLWLPLDPTGVLAAA